MGRVLQLRLADRAHPGVEHLQPPTHGESPATRTTQVQLPSGTPLATPNAWGESCNRGAPGHRHGRCGGLATPNAWGESCNSADHVCAASIVSLQPPTHGERPATTLQWPAQLRHTTCNPQRMGRVLQQRQGTPLASQGLQGRFASGCPDTPFPMLLAHPHCTHQPFSPNARERPQEGMSCRPARRKEGGGIPPPPSPHHSLTARCCASR